MFKFREKLEEPLPIPFQGVGPKTRLFKEIDTLNKRRDDLSTEELWDQYKHIFQTFLSTDKTVSSGDLFQESVSAENNPSTPFQLKENLINLIPKTYREKTQKLYNFIKPALDANENWSVRENGAVFFKNKSMNANILDYLAYSTGRYKIEPNGYQVFNKFLLKELSIPYFLLRKPEIVKQVEVEKEEQGEPALKKSRTESEKHSKPNTRSGKRKRLGESRDPLHSWESLKKLTTTL